MDREMMLNIHRHTAGRGIAPVPAGGAGFFDKLKGFAKQAFNVVGPMVAKAGRSLAKDVVSDLHKRVITL